MNRAASFPFVILSAIALSLPALARAQDYSRVAPQTPPAAPAPRTLPEAPAVALASGPSVDRVLLADLRGLVFLGDRAALQTAGVTSNGLQFVGTPLLDTPAFRALAERHLGQPLTLRTLNSLTSEAVLHYRRLGRPVVDVLVPEQNISTGTVQILVVEAHLGRVLAEGNRHFSTAALTGQIRLQPGRTIESAPLLADMVWLNQNPFRQVDLVFSRGAAPGETDIILRTQDRRPWRLYTGYEDSGNDVTGDSRIVAGLNWGDAFGCDALLNYQFTTSPDPDQLTAHSASFALPLASRQVLTVFGSYATSQPTLPGGFFDLKGTTWQLSARLAWPPVASGANASHQFSAGFDFKRSNNDLAFGGLQVYALATDIVQGVIAYDYAQSDARGGTNAGVQLVWSPGGLSSGNRGDHFRAARAFARDDYAYLRASVERRTNFRDWTLVTRLTGQLSSANLLGSEQLGLGGYANLRGYEEREVNGDHGVALTNEIHAPARPLFRGSARGPDRLDSFVFLDAGVAASRTRLPGEDSALTLASTGVGINYSLGAAVQLRFTYGWQLKDSQVSDGRHNHRGHLGLTLAY